MELINNEAADTAMVPQLGSPQLLGLNTPKSLCFKRRSESCLTISIHEKQKLIFFGKIQDFLATRLFSQTIWFLKQSELYIFLFIQKNSFFLKRFLGKLFRVFRVFKTGKII